MTTLAAVQFYDVVLWVHITAVVVAFGPTFAFAIYGALTMRNHPRAIPAVLEAQNTISMTLVTWGGTLVLLSGIYLAADGDWFDTFFVGFGFVAIIALLGLTHGYFLRHDRAALRAAQRDIEAAGSGEVKFSDEFNAATARSARMGPVAGLIIVLTIYVMAAKPFL